KTRRTTRSTGELTRVACARAATRGDDPLGCPELDRRYRYIRSLAVHQIGSAAPLPALEIALPRTLDRSERHPVLDRPSNRVGATQNVDRQAPLLELVGRPAPREASRREPARDRDLGQPREERL